MFKVGFIGCGNMGGALVEAVVKSGFSGEVLICDHNDEKTKALSDKLSVKISDSVSVAKECKYIFIGVKPQVIEKCFADISAVLQSRTDCVVVSMAAGISIEKIKSMSHCKKNIRIMPNMPVSVGKGVVLGSFDNVSDNEKKEFESIMTASGIFDWIDEKLIDSASALSGCGPAFVYMFIEALADGAVACGLPRNKALLYSSMTVLGSAQAMIESGKHPGELKDEVCSPGGTTIQGVRALENGSFRADSMEAVIAAYEKTKKL